ncbi:MAG: segregation/condensation protein A [Rhodospirillaceae bacterium]|nr:segregation/condensation protein A [Rhodospirillaceae bacterium]
MANTEDFEDIEMDEMPSEDSPASFVIDIDGFEGPIDVLLTLARNQKVDITQISIVQLADQYLAFVAEARHTSLELAADYLVMAAWLAYLKSRLLLPDLDGDDEPSGEEMAAALAFQLKRLESMQNAGARLMARSHLNREFFARGVPEKFTSSYTTVFEVTLYDLLKCYGEQKHRNKDATLHIEAYELYAVEDALERLHKLVGKIPDWQTLLQFMPSGLKKGLGYTSAVASTFAASLEMVREGRLRLRQSGHFEPIYIRSNDQDLQERPRYQAEEIVENTTE